VAPPCPGHERQGGVRVEAAQESVGPDFFATVGSKLIAGRDFSLDRAADVEPATDKKNSAVTNIVIDRSLAEAMGWSPEAAIGQTLFEFGPGWTWELTVTGVVEDRMISLQSNGRRGTIFQFQGNNVWYPLIRVSRDHANDTAQAVTAALNALSPTRPVRLEWEATRLIGAAAGLHAEAMFFGGLTLFALFIAIIGLAGMAFHATGRRLREIGIRKTLGASSALILRLLLIDFSRPVVLAVLLSWPVGFLAAQGYLSLFTQRTTISATPFLGSLAMCLGMGALAVGAQTLRAARGNPADILRDE
jgi:putative ABC transport system permease protein